jgi:D-lactate dehydrogenase
MGFDLFGKTIGLVGVGNIGSVVAQIAIGFGCKVLAHDPVQRPECECLGVNYVSLEHLLEKSDIVSLHCPLNDGTRHLIDAGALRRMREGALLINTSRGAVVATPAVIDALKRGHLGGVAIDVYEEEDALFFEDRSDQAIMDDQFARLLTFPNVLITGHQGFFTVEALKNIAATTIGNLDAFEQGGEPLHPVMIEPPLVAKTAQPAFAK